MREGGKPPYNTVLTQVCEIKIQYAAGIPASFQKLNDKQPQVL